MAKVNPNCFFIKATAMDYAMDLEGKGRTIQDWSPYQALFGTGNVELLEKIKPDLDDNLATLDKDERAKIQNQEQEKFPEGFDFPPCTDKFNQLMHDLVIAIGQDTQLQQDWWKPNTATFEALAELKIYLKLNLIKILTISSKIQFALIFQNVVIPLLPPILYIYQHREHLCSPLKS